MAMYTPDKGDIPSSPSPEYILVHIMPELILGARWRGTLYMGNNLHNRYA